jgi:hypothetical protein
MSIRKRFIMDTNESLLRAILATMACGAFPLNEIHKIGVAKNGGDKQIAAYNLCGGKTPQSEIGKKTKLDPASLSRSISRWDEAGVVVRMAPNSTRCMSIP